MLNLIRAEWLKIAKNVRLTASLVWIFPIGAVTVLLVGILINTVSGDFAGYMGRSSWTTDLVGIWSAINRFPLNVFGRLLPLAFMAAVFAGEFQWETWRLIVPKTGRTRLVIAKLLAVTITILLALTATSLITVLLQAASHAALGHPYQPAVTGAEVANALRMLGLEVLIATLSLLLLGSFAAVAALITKSMLGALLLTFGFSIAEQLSLAFLALLSFWFKRPQILNAYRYMPNFNLENLRAWMVDGHGLVELPFNVAIEAGALESVVFVAAWILAISGWMVVLFRRMDITR